jgi:pilus assembly protein Flp/PilA
MQLLSAAIRSVVKNEEGATMVEYGLMLALIAIVCIAAVTAIGTNANTTFTNAAGALSTT